MRLVRCHIENFGKLHDVTLDFQEGLQTFCRENGWGKSTLAAFVRVMLYGFMGETKRSSQENERKRYEPWQGGVYGGSLTFETNGKQYVIQRVFRDKAANDLFELRDAVTNLESKDFTTNIGEELFQINAEAFMRTAFIGQQDCVTNTTDSINAKIGNLADNTNDLNSYEVADEALKDLLNKMNPRVKKGSIHQLQEEITGLKKTVADGNGIEKSIETLQGYYEDALKRLEDAKGKKAAISAKQEEVSRYQDVLAKKESYDLLCRDVEEKEAQLQEKRQAFPHRIPTETEIRNALQKCTEIEKSETQRGLSPEEEQSYNEGLKFFGSEHPSGEINRLSQMWQERATIKSTLAVQQAGVDMMRRQQMTEQDSKKKKLQGLLILAICLMGFAGGMVIFGMQVRQMALMAVGAPMLIVGAVLVMIYGKTKNEMSVCEDIPLEDELAGNKNRIEDIEKQVYSYFLEHGVHIAEGAAAQNENDVREELQQLLNRALIFENLLEKLRKYDMERPDMERRLQEMRDSVVAFMNEIGAEAVVGSKEETEPIRTENIKGRLQQLTEELSVYNTLLKGLEAARKKRDDYESQYNLRQIAAEYKQDEMISMQELQEQYSEAEQEAEQLRVGIKTYEEQLNVLQEQYDEWVATRELLELKEAEYADKKKQYELLTKTKEYLGKAKESLTVRYTGPILEHFNRYYAIVTGTEDGSYRMDANINVTREEQGLQRDVAFLSTGYQDLIGVCLRLALVDAMYSGEKPMLIMDDPFVNLDGERTEGSKRLLDALVGEYQIIYFTCKG